MAVIEPEAFTITDAEFTVGDDDFAGSCSSIVFTPTSTTSVWQGLKKTAVRKFKGATQWAVAVDFAQDWETAEAFARFLLENDGEIMPATFAPIIGGTSFETELLITPGSIGGAGDGNAATSSVTLEAQGALVPTYVDAPPVTP